jgi:hypothetical protein
MAAGTITLYDRFAKYLGDGTIDIDLAGSTLTGALFLSTSNCNTASNNIYGDLTNEVATAYGYTQGGIALTSIVWTQATAKCKFSSASPQWTASGGSIVARFFVIYCNATLNGIVKPLVGRCLLSDGPPADVTATAGQPFIVTPDATLGWATLGPGTLT